MSHLIPMSLPVFSTATQLCFFLNHSFCRFFIFNARVKIYPIEILGFERNKTRENLSNVGLIENNISSIDYKQNQIEHKK